MVVDQTASVSVFDEFQTFDVDGMAIGTLLCQKQFGENSKVDP